MTFDPALNGRYLADKPLNLQAFLWYSGTPCGTLMTSKATEIKRPIYMRVIETTVDSDLSDFSRYLWRHGVHHRVFEERGLQIVELADANLATQVTTDFAAWQAGDMDLSPGLPPQENSGEPHSTTANSLFRIVRTAPVVVVLLVFSMIAYGLVELLGPDSTVLRLFYFVDPAHMVSTFGAWLGTLPGQSWRAITPIFLHFSVVHILFNSAVIWELGRRIEQGIGHGQILLIVVFVAVTSHLVQFFWTLYPYFGGLSGVAYGFVGFLIVAARRQPWRAEWQLPPGFVIGMLFFLVLFSTGIADGLIGGRVANAVHWSGLIAGACAGFFLTRTTNTPVAD